MNNQTEHNIKQALGIVSGLCTFPVKSLTGVIQDEIEATALGPRGDRRWMVVRPSGEFLTQRENHRMTLVLVSETDDGIALMVPALAPISLTTPKENVIDVNCWGDSSKAVDAGDVAAAYLSNFLGESVRLVYMPETNTRHVEKAFLDEQTNNTPLSFADGFPYLLVNEASVRAFEERLGRSFCSRRFRPNIIIQGTDAFQEDSWQRIQIGEVEFDLVKPCERCVIPAIETNKAERETDVSKALISLRRTLKARNGVEKNGIYFGQNMVARNPGIIRRGDSVVLLK